MLSRKKASKKKDSLYTFNEYLDNKDNLATKSLEGHPWSKKFLSKIFQINRKSAYSNEDFDEFISKLDLDNLEKLLYPARIIEATNITSMLFSLNSAINPDVLADTLTVLTSNIDILKNLYTLDIPFSAISSKLSRIESKVPGILKKVLEGSKTMLPNLNKNTYEEICKKRADVLNFVKKIKIKSDAINSANDDVDNNITNQTTIEQNSLDLYIANNNKLKGSLWSTKFFLSKIFQTNRKSACSNENFDKFISKLDLDNLEKLLYPARIIEATNITNMLSRLNRMINLDVLAKTLTVLTSNIYMLKNLYTLGRSFSTISGKLCHIGSSAPYCLDKLFTFLKIEIELQKNDEDFLTSLKICVQKLDFVKKKGQETRKNVIDIMLKKHSNIQEINNDNDEKINETVHELTNNLTINNTRSQIIDKHREDDIETNSDEINTHSNSQELAANISNSALVACDILNRELVIDDDDNNIKEIELDLNNDITHQFENQSQPIESYQENNIENLQIIRQTHTEKVMQSVKKRKSCYDDHEDHSYARKRQCNNPELNSDHDTEVALDKLADSINVDCPTSVTISHLAGESICSLSSDTEGFSITGTA